MNGIDHLILISIVIIIDIMYNWHLIETKHKEPNHYLLWLTRAMIAIAIVYNPDKLEWVLRALALVPLYWFVFDYGLNKARGKRLMYLGDESLISLKDMIRHYDGSFSLLDQIQLKTLGEYPWFIFKGILALFSIINMLYNYDPYSPL